LKQYGLNILEEEKQKSILVRLLEQYTSYMQIVLLIAAVVSLFIKEYGTFLLLFMLTVCNAILGYRLEAKAAASVAALNKMMKTVAKVRRDGAVIHVDASEIVPGDIVILDAGDRVAADGRIISAENLQIEESALTGESNPSDKSSDLLSKPDLSLGDRLNMAYMNTNVTRGHGRLSLPLPVWILKWAISQPCSKSKSPKRPLTVQIDRVTLFIIGMAVLAFVSILVLGLFQGEPFTKLFTIGISLAIGSIPDALPAVVISILAMGTVAMAGKNAIIKSLPAVETLGSTSAINSDKTGTLTMNQMTVRVITTVEHRYIVSVEGYSFSGTTNVLRVMLKKTWIICSFPVPFA
jgi:Ca2+-transporting ATPase